MVLLLDNTLGALIGDDSSEFESLVRGQIESFPLGVFMLGGNDTVQGSEDSEQIHGNQGNDQLTGGFGLDTLFGGKDSDTLNGQIDGDFLFGNLGDDLLIGGDGDDQLFGGRDGDILLGDTGNDTLSGDEGMDTLFGGQGNDLFVLSNSDSSTDFIFDFEDGIDQISLLDGLDFSDLEIQHKGMNQTTIILDSKELAILDRVNFDSITGTDFGEPSQEAEPAEQPKPSIITPVPIPTPTLSPTPSNNQPPVAESFYQTIGNVGRSTNVPNLTGIDRDGEIIRFTITELPDIDTGTLFLEGEEISILEVVDELSPQEARQLRFLPAEEFEGEVNFTYVAVDNDGAQSQEATITLDVSEPPSRR